MIRQAPRILLRSSLPLRTPQSRRLLSTAPPAQKSRSWKSYTTRLGLAAGVVYFYNTSELFAEEPPFSIPPPVTPTEETSLPTLESLAPRHPPSTQDPPSPSTADAKSSPPTTPTDLTATEEEASQEGAFNEETGEINWDCPCLGGMAHGPCGEQFRTAFTCFIFSKEEPKGMDCIDNFKTMQDCFRQHPDVYATELEDDEAPEEEGSLAAAAEGGEVPVAAISASPSSNPTTPSSSIESPSPPSSSPPTPPSTSSSPTQRAQAAKEQVQTTQPEATSESDELVPKAAHDATAANAGK